MTTEELTDFLQIMYQGWSVTGVKSLLTITDQVQKLMYARPCEQNIFIDDATGFYPFLSTTAGTYKYDCADKTINLEGTDYTVRCGKTEKIFIDVTNESESDLRWLGAPYQLNYLNPFSNDTTLLTVADVPVKSGDAGDNTKAWVKFFNSDPGTNASKYYHKFVIEPVPLTAITIPLTLPVRFHDILMEGCIAKLEMFDKKDPARWFNFTDNILPDKFMYEMNQSAQGTVNHTPPRSC